LSWFEGSCCAREQAAKVAGAYIERPVSMKSAIGGLPTL